MRVRSIISNAVVIQKMVGTSAEVRKDNGSEKISRKMNADTDTDTDTSVVNPTRRPQPTNLQVW